MAVSGEHGAEQEEGVDQHPAVQDQLEEQLLDDVHEVAGEEEGLFDGDQVGVGVDDPGHRQHANAVDAVDRVRRRLRAEEVAAVLADGEAEQRLQPAALLPLQQRRQGQRGAGRLDGIEVGFRVDQNEINEGGGEDEQADDAEGDERVRLQAVQPERRPNLAI